MPRPLIVIASLAALTGCTTAQLQSFAPGYLGDAIAVARAIDAGYAIASQDLPVACRITTSIADVAQGFVELGVLKGSAQARLKTAADAAVALGRSELCLDPASNPVAASLQVVRTVAAVKAALRPKASVTASAVAASAVAAPQ